MATETFTGPIDYVVFAFEDGASIGPGLHRLIEHVDAGLVELLDLELVRVDADGRAQRGTLDEEHDASGLDLSVFAGAASGILEQDDLDAIAAQLQDGQFALVVVYEERTLADAADAWLAAGGVELLAGGVDIEDLEHALEHDLEGEH